MTNEFDIESLRKIFLGGLNRATTDDGLRSHFEKYGEIVDCVVIRGLPEQKGGTGTSRGFGYVTFASSDMVDALLEDRPHIIEDKEVEVKRAIPRDENNPTSHQKTTKIFVGGLPRDTTEEEIRNYFSNPDLKVTVTNVEMIKKDGEFRGFCFVSFTTEDMVDKLTIIKTHSIKGNKKSEVKKAVPKNSEGGGQTGGPRGGMGGGSRGGSRGRGFRGGPPGGFSQSRGYSAGGNTGFSGGNAYGSSGGYGMYGGGYGIYGGGCGNGGSFTENTGYGGGYGADFQIGSNFPQAPSNFGPSRGGRGMGRGGSGMGRGSRGGFRPY